MSGSHGRPQEMLQCVGVQNIGYVQITDTDGTLRDGGVSKHPGSGDGHVDVASWLEAIHVGGFQDWMMIDAWEIPGVYDACIKGQLAIDAALDCAKDG